MSEPVIAALRQSAIQMPVVLSVPNHKALLEKAADELEALHAVVGDAQAVIVDYSEGRVDPLVALGKIGLWLLRATG